MKPTLIDSNVLLDIFTQDPHWFDWSASQLSKLADQSLLIINPIIYAEVSVRFSRIEVLDGLLLETDFNRERIPYAAAFLAAKAFQSYKGRGGVKQSRLPDFFIGAHAAVRDYQLLTRDRARYRTYYPTLSLIVPDSEHYG